MLKIKCYNKYNDQHLIMSYDDDSVMLDSSASHYASGCPRIQFAIDDEYYKEHKNEYAEDPDVERWSDLTDFKIIIDKV